MADPLNLSDAKSIVTAYANGFAAEHPEWSGLAQKYAATAALLYSRDPGKALGTLVRELGAATGQEGLLPVATTLTRLGLPDAQAVAAELVQAEGTDPAAHAAMILRGLARREQQQRVDARTAAAVAKVRAALAREMSHLATISVSEAQFIHNVGGYLFGRNDLLSEAGRRQGISTLLTPEPAPAVPDSLRRNPRYS